MRDEGLARRYAAALAEAAFAASAAEQIEEDLEGVGSLLREQGDLWALLLTPRLSKERRLKAIQELLEGKVHPYVLHLLLLAVQKGREQLLPDIIRLFRQICQQRRGEVTVVVLTPEDLTEDRLSDIRQRLEERLDTEVLLETRLEPEIIGGIVLRIGDRVIDGSIRRRLEDLRRRLKEAPLPTVQ